MKYLNYSLFLVILLVFTGCEKNDPTEKTPSFIHIENIEIDADYATYGSNSNKAITDAWVYIGNELIGTFELPATVPILHDGNQTIKIHAGIKRNGISKNRVKYPMLKEYVIDTILIPDAIININPVVSYNSEVSVWFEDFETGAIKLYDSSNSSVNIKTTTNNVFEGNASGTGIFKSTTDRFEIKTDEANFDGLIWNNLVYMELDYATTHQMTAGISYKKSNASIDTDAGYLNVLATDSIDVVWNKIYIDLSEATQPESPFDDLDFFIGLQATNGNPLPKILIDNVKVITY